MQPHASSPQLEPRNGVLVLTGYGLRLAIDRGHLLAEDGVAADRRLARFGRIDQELKRVVIIGHSGVITILAKTLT